jgi:hypothetical protein
LGGSGGTPSKAASATGRERELSAVIGAIDVVVLRGER